MLLGLWVSVLFGHAKVDHVDDIGILALGTSDQKVVWLDIAVNEVLFVNRLDTRELVVGDKLENQL